MMRRTAICKWCRASLLQQLCPGCNEYWHFTSAPFHKSFFWRQMGSLFPKLKNQTKMCLNFCAAIPRKHWHVSICLSPCLCLCICLFQIRGFHPLLNAIPRQYWPVWVGNQIKPTAFSTSSSYKTFFRQRKNIPATPSLAALCTVQLIWLGIYVSALLESIHCRRQNAPMLLLYLITIFIIM